MNLYIMPQWLSFLFRSSAADERTGVGQSHGVFVSCRSFAGHEGISWAGI